MVLAVNTGVVGENCDVAHADGVGKATIVGFPQIGTAVVAELSM